MVNPVELANSHGSIEGDTRRNCALRMARCLAEDAALDGIDAAKSHSAALSSGESLSPVSWHSLKEGPCQEQLALTRGSHAGTFSKPPASSPEPQ